MSEEERLGKLAFDAYMGDRYGAEPNLIMPWHEQPAYWQRSWIAAARAVVEEVLRKQQTAVEASE